MTNLVPMCPGTITVNETGGLLCSQVWQSIESPAITNPLNVDPLLFAEYMAAGFSIALPVMVFAWGGRYIYQSIIGIKT